jgi:LuxR family transcriptional regulator, quorum-sensing system regulator CciR
MLVKPGSHRRDLHWQDAMDAVRVTGSGDVRRAAEALHKIAIDTAEMRVAPTHNIADKLTPVDAKGAILAHEVFGWEDKAQVWWKNTRIALNSPITAACRYESEPFWVNADGFRTRQLNHYLDTISLTNFETRAMTRAAIVVPIHLPFGQIGAVSFNPLNTDKTDLQDEFDHYSDFLKMVAHTFIGSYVHAMGQAQRLPSASRLSKREVECLRWAAIGKTDLEISMIITRSRATVRFHIHNASVKLDAVNRSQTLFKASQLGYITLST